MSKVMDLFFKLDIAMTGGFGNKIGMFQRQIAGATQSLNKLQSASGKISQYEKLQSNITQTNGALARAKYNYNSMTPQVQAAQSKCSDLAVTLGRERGVLRQTGMLYGTNSKEYQAQAKVVKELEKAHREAAKSYQKFADEQNKAGDKVKSLEEKLSGQKQQASELGRALESAGVNTRNLTSEQSRLQAQMDKVANLKSKFESLKQSLSWGNIKADLMTAYSLIKPFQKPINLAADFESAMARVQAAGFVRKGSDLSQLEKLREQALHLGDSTKYTSIEAAATQETLIRGGLKVPDVINIMPSVMAMATAENLDLNRSAEILVGLNSAMDITSDKAGHTADVLAIMSASYKTNIDSMYEGMSKAAGIAHTLKMPIEHLAALSAIAQQLGVDASTAGTSIKTGLIRISSDVKKFTKLGVRIQDNNGNFRQIDQILSDLFTKLQKYGPTKQVEILGDLFGKNSVDTWSKLITGQGRGMVTEAINIGNTEADGTTQRMQDIIMQTYNGNKALFESSIAGLQTWIGDKLKPINEYIMKKATGAISTVTGFAKNNDTAAGTIMQGAYMAGGAYTGYKAFGYLSKGVQLAKTWLELKGATAAVAEVTTAAAEATGAVSTVSTVAAEAGSSMTAIGTGAQTAAGAVSTAASNMIASLGVVSAVVYAIYKNWEAMNNEGIHMHDNLIKMKSAAGSNRDTSQSTPRTSTFGGRKRALGGMITRPEIALIGEAGPEVVIPLSPGKKSRGMQLLNTAASSLGVNITSPAVQNYSSQGISNNTSNLFDSSERLSSTSYINNNNKEMSSSNNFSPSVNIVINAENSEINNQSGMTLANDIYSRVKEALSELMNNEDRLSYA